MPLSWIHGFVLTAEERCTSVGHPLEVRTCMEQLAIMNHAVHRRQIALKPLRTFIPSTRIRGHSSIKSAEHAKISRQQRERTYSTTR